VSDSAPQYAGRWRGGKIRKYADGSRAFQIIARVEGHVRTITLNAATEREAEKQLALFRGDRSTYYALQAARRPRRETPEQEEQPPELPPIFCVENYDAWNSFQRDPPDPLDPDYIAQSRRYLLQWVTALGKDLRECELADLNVALDGFAGGRAHRVKALKSFTYWARMKGKLRPEEDPTRELKVPPAQRADHRRDHSQAEVEAVYRLLPEQLHRDMVCVLALTGAHHKEMLRASRGTRMRLVEHPDQGQIKAVLWAYHKLKYSHPYTLNAQALAAFKRMLTHEGGLKPQPQGGFVRTLAGGPDRNTLRRAIQRAVEGTDVAPIHAGALRHSFSTWANLKTTRLVQPREGGSGISREIVARRMGHSWTMSTRVYDGTEVPEMIVPAIKLSHPEDPPSVGQATGAPRQRRPRRAGAEKQSGRRSARSG
jgi:integrase